MKTLGERAVDVAQYARQVISHVSEHNLKVLEKKLLSEFAEIQRDAREGMVPEEDVKPLLQHLYDHVHIESSTPLFSHEEELEKFRAKHPNLFPK